MKENEDVEVKKNGNMDKNKVRKRKRKKKNTFWDCLAEDKTVKRKKCGRNENAQEK